MTQLKKKSLQVIKRLTKREKNGWAQWELQQRHRKYKKVPNRSHGVEGYKTDLKTTLEKFKLRPDEATERIGDLEDQTVELTPQSSKKKKRISKSEDILRHLWWNNIYIISVQEEEERKGYLKK